VGLVAVASDPLTLASLVAGITGVGYHTQLMSLFLKNHFFSLEFVQGYST
jgi:hypothetical protein